MEKCKKVRPHTLESWMSHEGHPIFSPKVSKLVACNRRSQRSFSTVRARALNRGGLQRSYHAAKQEQIPGV